MFEAVIHDAQKRYLPGELSGIELDSSSRVVGSVAALCSAVFHNNAYLEGQILDWISKGQGGAIQTLGMRRAILATFSSNKGMPQFPDWNLMIVQKADDLILRQSFWNP